MDKLSAWFVNLLTFEGMELNESLLLIAKALAIFLLFCLFRHLFAKYTSKLLLCLTKKSKFKYDDQIIQALLKPIEIFFVFIGFFLACNCLPLPVKIAAVITILFRCAIIYALTRGILNLLTVYEKICLDRGQILKINADKMLVTVFIKICKIITVILAFIMIAEECGYSVSSFVAGLGLGGLAIALAAQSMLEELFNGIALMADKPFKIGDWIICSNIEGTVEEINFRSSKVRTFDQQLVTIPNTTLVNSPLHNYSRTGKRRILCRLGLTYGTTHDQMVKVVADLREMLKNDPNVWPGKIYVTFDNYGDSALEIQLYFYVKTGDYGEYLQMKEQINLKIMQLLETDGVTAAFPSTSVYFENNLTTAGPDFSKKAEQS